MLLLLPTGMNYRTERYPVVTFALIGTNCLVYLVSLACFFATGGDSDLWIQQHLWLIPSKSILSMYLTSMFVHEGFFHLFGNMLFLFLFGSCVEDIIGRWRFLVYYLFGGFVAEMTFIAMSPGHFALEIPMGGASGAISACMGAYLLLRASADIEFKYLLWIFVIKAGEFTVPAWIAITFWFLKDLFWAVLGMFSDHTGGGVAFGAHVGGFIAGMGMGSIYRALQRKEPHRSDFELEQFPANILAPAPRPASTSEVPTIYLVDNGVQSGPFTLSQIQSRLTRGEISHDALYWSEGMTNWETVLDLAASPML